MATRLITPFCAASALFAALVADGALPLSWEQLDAGTSRNITQEGERAASRAVAKGSTSYAGANGPR